MYTTKKMASIFAAILTFVMFYASLGSAAEGTVEVISSWQAQGHAYPTAPSEVTFVGVLSGVLYVRGADGSFDTGHVTCPGTITMNTTDYNQIGDGKCVIITPDSERIYAKFNCSGIAGSGCNGDFELTGGTGSKKDISGNGSIQFKSALLDLMQVSGNVIETSYVGLALIPKLTYRVP